MAVRRIWDVSSGPTKPLGHAKLTVGSSAVGLGAALDSGGGAFAIPEDATRVVIRVLNNPVNYTDVAGQNPTASFGFPLFKDETLVYDGDPNLFKAIRSGASDAELRIAYYGND